VLPCWILATVGLKTAERMQGESLLPLIRGEKPPWRSEFFYEHLFRHASIPRSEAVRDQRYKYIRFLDTQPPYEELYDLSVDPHEAQNLAGKPEHTPTLQRMRKTWQAWRERAK
jgi:arylsulfatase A-like enzyme